jgi:proline iminopeptidase
MKHYLFIMLFFTSVFFAQDKRESILDKISYVDTTLYTEIPQVPRWCDKLELEKQKINTGDCNLYVEEEGAGIPIILINGGPGGTHHYFHPWFSEAAKYARIIYYDQRGCGLSDFNPGKEGYSVEQAVNDLEAIRKELKIDKWVLLGYSYGGFLAQYYTTKYPQNTAGLILVGASPNIDIDDNDSREDMFVTREENERLDKIRTDLNAMYKAGRLTKEKLIQLLIFNNYINADWKRQNFYKPTRERTAEMALYEWVNDSNFNSIMNNSENKIDLTGAFNLCPIPTLILEGKWDLTWSEKKKEALKTNHPGSRMIVFENAGHGIYDEETACFFASVKEFITNLTPVDKNALEKYAEYLEKREKEMAASPKHIINSVNWGIASSKTLAQKYSREWLNSIKDQNEYLRIGFALYDTDNYNEALYVFEQMEKIFSSSSVTKAMALIWQGHMLDLLGKRNDAVLRYKAAYDMDLDTTLQNGQYGLNYKISPYSKERMNTPFVKKENRQTD